MIRITLNIFLLISIFSCGRNSQNAVNSSKQVNVNDKIISQTNASVVDPYFKETTKINSKKGPNNITRNLIQDKKGNYWFATWEGIIGFDGNSFTNYTNKEALKRYRAFSILEDRSGNIWFGTIGAGVYIYDGKNFRNLNTEDGLVHNNIYCIYEDSNGHIWIGTKEGASHYDGKRFKNYTTKDGLLDNDINSIIEDDKGVFWFGTRGEACTFNGRFFNKLVNSKGLPFVNVRSIIKDKKGNIWLGGNDGLWIFKNGEFSNITTDFVGYIYEDKNESIWTSSESYHSKSIWRLTKYVKNEISDVYGTQIFSAENMFFGILEDKKGDIWIGTLNGLYRNNNSSTNDFKEFGK